MLSMGLLLSLESLNIDSNYYYHFLLLTIVTVYYIALARVNWILYTYCLVFCFCLQLFDMLRQIGTLPPQAKGCFYDYLTGTSFTSIDGKLHKCDPKSGNQPIPLFLSIPTSNASPETYLHKLIVVEGSAVINTEGTIATNKNPERCIVRSTRALSERSCWQFHVPGPLYGFEFGVCYISNNGSTKYLPFTFNSSTSRTITFMVHNHSIKTWVNQSSPSKNNSKNLQWDVEQCYPYAALPSKTSTVILNPFAAQPNSKVSPSNPFNTSEIKVDQSIKRLPDQQIKRGQELKILDVKQLNKDRLLLVAEGGFVKIIDRDPETNKIQFSQVQFNQDTVTHLFTNEEWSKLISAIGESNMQSIQWSKNYKLSDALEIIKNSIIKLSSSDDQIATNLDIYYLLLCKLAIVRPYIHQKIPNSIMWSEVDRKQHHYSHLFFKNLQSSPLKKVPAALVRNSAPWTKLDGIYLQSTQNYICSVSKCDSDSQSSDISIYFVNDFGIKKVFTGKITEDKLQFSKAKSLDGYSGTDTNLWKENVQSSQIYKILSGCFANQGPSDTNIFEARQKDIKELVQVFNTEKDEAVIALEQTGNLQDALAWLADTNHKITRRKKGKIDQKSEKQRTQSRINCSIVEIKSNSLTSKIFLHINNAIYILGFDPCTLMKKYIQRTEKGFISLSSFQFGTSLLQINSDFVNEGINHSQLIVLDSTQFQNAATGKIDLLSIFLESNEIYAAVKKDEALYKIRVQFNQQNVYKQSSCLKSNFESMTPISKQQSDFSKLFSKTTKGELAWKQNEKLQQEYQSGSYVVVEDKILSNSAAADTEQLTNYAEAQIRFDKPQLQFPDEESGESKFLPLLVQRGPPGCNLNYPICSILYPKAPLPFLANYPYSLTFRHLHSKCMKVSEVIIQRIGQKHNVNEIKEGIIYFADDSNIQSRRYKFKFDSKNELVVNIDEQNYYRYMIIEPTYNSGSKLPYQIGFMGAKGWSIEVEQYQKSIISKIQQNIQIFDSKGKCRFQVLQINPLTFGAYNTVLQFSSVEHKNLTLKNEKSNIAIKPKDSNINILSFNTKLQTKLNSLGSRQRQQPQLKTSQIASLSPSQLINKISKIVSKSRQGKQNPITIILRQVSKNDNISLKQYNDSQIKILTDMFISSKDLSIKEYQCLFDKIKSQNQVGSKYLDEIITHIGTGVVLIQPKYMQFILNRIVTKQNSSIWEQIILDLLKNVDKHRNPNYQILQKQYGCPYLLLESNYYSKHYYNQIKAIDEGSLGGEKCDKIFKKQNLLNYKFATVKESKIRKIIIKLSQKSSIRNILLRFDRSDVTNKVQINIYAWVGEQKILCANCLLYEHQWIQITKNPYRKQMINMFESNHSWLNAYGVTFQDRVETSYIQIQAMFSFNGVHYQDAGGQSVTEILPQIYGYSTGTSVPNSHLDQSYFKYSEDEKIFLSKIPLKLQIQSQSNSSEPSTFFNKYLINKQNMVEYQLFECSELSEGETKLEKDELAIEFKQNIEQLVRITSEVPHEGVMLKKHNPHDLIPILNKYHQLMKSLSDDNSHVRISQKLSLDFCYTLIFWILEIQIKKQIKIHQKIAKTLLQQIIKKDIGPISFACLKSISQYPDLLVQGLSYIKISSQSEKGPSNSISTAIFKGNSSINITDSNIDKTLQSKDQKLAESLLNILIDTKPVNDTSIQQCIRLAKITGKHEKILKYILKSKEKQQNKNQLFKQDGKEKLYEQIIRYIFGKEIPQKLRNQNFIDKLEPEELEGLILWAKKTHHDHKQAFLMNPSYLMNKLLHDKKTKQISLDIVSLIFELSMQPQQQWDLLQKCIRLCPTAEDMIHCQYLSASRQQKDELLQLAIFHRDILYSAVKSQKNAELLANFLGEVFVCDRKLFIEVVMSLPDGQKQVFPLHPDIYSVIVRILEEQCNLGGIEGAKCSTLEQNIWLAVTLRLLKLSSDKLNQDTLGDHDIQSLIKWYLLNNEHEQYISNPINRSHAVSTIKLIAEKASQIINKVEGAASINKIFKIYTSIKQDIKRDSKKLSIAKHLILSRLQHGVLKLMENNLSPQSLTQALIGNAESKGLTEEIIKEIQQEEGKQTLNQGKSNQNLRETQLTDEAQIYTIQGGSITNLPCKDLQCYKGGSKSSIQTISVANKRMFIKPATNINMSKFIVGFSVQQTPEKNNIAPDSVQLFGGNVENMSTVPTNMRKICDLKIIEDQHYAQFGVKLFGINFDCICRSYINQTYNVLELRIKTLAQPSVSDVLQCAQKSLKNAVYHVSFITINGHKEETNAQLNFSNIYMKMLTFLSSPRFESSLASFIKHVQNHKGMLNQLIQLLSHKASKKAGSNESIQQLLISLSKHGVPVLQFLLKQSDTNQSLVDKILKSNIVTPNVDLVLQNILRHNNLQQQVVEDVSQIIKLNSLQKSAKQSKFKLNQIMKIADSYEKAVKKQAGQEMGPNSESKQLRKILACLTTSQNIYKFNEIQLIEKLFGFNKSTTFYPIIAGFVSNSNNTLNWFLKSGKVDEMSSALLAKMKQYKSDKNKQIQPDVSNIACLLSALCTYPPIRERLINNPDHPEIDQFPIKVFSLLSNSDTLIDQYPARVTRKFINLFQSTCTSVGTEYENACSEQFAVKLIQVMVKLPQTPSVYHNYFIHQFFFPIINAYNGILVNFLWIGQNKQNLAKPTRILQKLPIRKNDTQIQHKGKYYRIVASNEQLVSDTSKIIVFNQKVVAQADNGWKVVNGGQESEHQLKQVIFEKNSIKLIMNNGDNKQLNISDKQSVFKCYTADPQISNELSKLLTNQTLLRIKKPTLFGKNYTTNLPITIGMLSNVYLVPAQMTLQQMLKEVNICGYSLSEETRKNIKIYLHNQMRQVIKPEEKFSNIFSKVSDHKPLIEVEVNANQLFKFTTIQKIANQSDESSQQSKFIAQETIFKSFEKLKGLEKMIKVIMACVKNWSNQRQSKIWTQYLSELSSFSCFPIFSSIYMNKQQNVELLFSLLSGLPDKEQNTKWLEQEKKSVKFLYDIIKNVFQVEGEQAIIIRNYAVQSGFFQTMLERLHLITKEPKRSKVEENAQQQEIEVPSQVTKKVSEEEYKKQIKKKKGIGYGNDSSTNQNWDIAGHQQAKKQLSDQIVGLIKILQKFLSYPKFQLPKEYLQITYCSALLPILQASLRAGSLLQISKKAELFKEELKFIKALAKNEVLVPSLLDIPKIYEPKQSESIFSLLSTLEGTSKIFLSCLNREVSQKTSQDIAKNIIQTFNFVQEAIQNYKSDHVDQQAEKKILELPLTKKYPILMKDLRFDYIDMKDKNGKIKHHYSSSYQAKYTPPPTKAIRLAQQLADISQALPIQHTNAIFVRCDKDRVDFMQALIMGSNGTPYGHGAYLFDIHFDDSYPNNPPKVNLTTTGSGAIRFNPNLYSCGKVCLSLLGTWRGSAMENWDPKVSTLLQVLVSIQSIIMAEQIYFNQPGFEHEQGTVEGEKKNEGYSNIVRYGNIKFAMIENIKNPPKGFETVIRRHFYLKKDQILKQCNKWLKFAEKRQAAYTGLVSDHNNNWSNTFKKSKTEYQTMLDKAIKQLQVELNKLPEPSSKDLQKQNKVSKKQKKEKKQAKIEKDENLEQIDVTYDAKNATQASKNYKELDINDEKVKDRWSRYIGAMGLQAVSKQSKANILMFGLSGLGIEIAKNIVLSGCKRFTACDDENTNWNDLSGQFYLSEDDIGKSRVESSLYKLQDLNTYVRVDSAKIDITKLQQDNKLKQYQVVISTIHDHNDLIILDNYCRKNGIKFIAAKCEGPYAFTFNDFGSKFQVLDKNGQETVECIIQNITNEESGVVTLLKGQKHPYEDGDVVKIVNVKGMQSKNQEGKSINQTVHKITVINQNSFKIGNTTEYTEYLGNGLVKNLKIPVEIDFKSFQQSVNNLNVDANLAYYDFSKGVNNTILHNCFRSLSQFKNGHKGQYPRSWNWDDGQELLSLYEKIAYQKSQQKKQMPDQEKAYVLKFSFTCAGSFAPLAAFYGGLVAQEAFKAITSKYMPINQFFFTDFGQVVQDLPKQFQSWKAHIENKKEYKPLENRFEGIRSIVGNDLLQQIRDCRIFVIGSGAIGCELLKNYAMINLATSEKPDKGTIVVTDPDHIQISNLNRQFLFREKHLQKPKSSTAAAVVKQMNKYLKAENKIRAKLIKVCQATKDTFSNEFFESMDIVTNALDNVQARQYVDLRCVQNKVALLESGTLSTKGHVQVIIPYKTQTYGSKADPAQEGDIPHCTLKMFPQETLHCVQWARDIFGRTFTMKPKALIKIIEGIDGYIPTSSDTSVLKDCLQMLQQKPNNFDDAVYIATKEFYKLYRNDIKQLLYTYPLDAKTKDGKDFWKLPKRPPTPVEQVDPNMKLHGQFITSYAVLLCKIFGVPYPKDFRTQQRRQQILKDAAKIKIDPFVPSDKVAKQMATEVQQNKNKQEQEIKQKTGDEENEDFNSLFKQIKQILSDQKEHGNMIKVQAEQFEKDQDSNGHVDLIYSMANLRASNYKLDPIDWITTKLKAGRITPALSTTTSCIAALQTIQLIKYLKKLPIDQMKNTFLNLAVPIIQAGEPGQIQKIKIHDDLITNSWERFSLEDVNFNQVTMGQLIKQIQEKYKIVVKTINIAGGGPIYSDIVLGLQSKKQQKEKLLKKKFKDVLNDQISVQELKGFIDLTIVMAVGQQFVKHVPTLRVNFKK